MSIAAKGHSKAGEKLIFAILDKMGQGGKMNMPG